MSGFSIRVSPSFPVCVDCLFLRSPSRVPYRTELVTLDINISDKNRPLYPISIVTITKIGALYRSVPLTGTHRSLIFCGDPRMPAKNRGPTNDPTGTQGCVCLLNIFTAGPITKLFAVVDPCFALLGNLAQKFGPFETRTCFAQCFAQHSVAARRGDDACVSDAALRLSLLQPQHPAQEPRRRGNSNFSRWRELRDGLRCYGHYSKRRHD